MKKKILVTISCILLAILSLTSCDTPVGGSETDGLKVTPILLPPTPAGTVPTLAKDEEEAWLALQCGDVKSLQDYLVSYPNSTNSQDIELYLALYKRIDEIKNGQFESALIIPFTDLGDKWEDWKIRLPEKGAVGYFRTAASMGIFYIPACRSISMDSYGMPVTPTGDGSIVGFRTDGLQLVYINSIVMQSAEGDILHFAVIDELGLVHLRGKGTVTFSDGTKIELQ